MATIMTTTDFPILTASMPKAAQMAGIGLTKAKQLVRDGIWETITVGHRRLVLVESIRRDIESRRGQGGDPRRNKAVPAFGERRAANPHLSNRVGASGPWI
jgi:hypothetical protein